MLYKICKMLFLQLFLPTNEPVWIKWSRKIFATLPKKDNFKSHFLSSKENSKSTMHYYSWMSVLPTLILFDALNFREFSFSTNFDKLKLNHSWKHFCYTYFLHRSSFENEYLIGICLPRLHFSKKETNCFWKRPPSLHKLANNLPMRNDAGAGKWSSRRQVKWTTTDVFFYEKVPNSEFSENRIPKTEFSKTEFPKIEIIFYVRRAFFRRGASRAFVIIRNDLPYRLLNLKERKRKNGDLKEKYYLCVGQNLPQGGIFSNWIYDELLVFDCPQFSGGVWLYRVEISHKKTFNF